MERETEKESNDGNFDPRIQASRVDRAFAFFCCALFLLWTVQIRSAAKFPSSVSIEEDSAHTNVSEDEQDAALSLISSLESEKSKEANSSASSAKLVLLVDLNSASKAELTTLPGVGEELAGRIVERRESVGAFSEVDELLEVKGIGPKKLAAARPFCTVGKGKEP